MKVPKTFMPDKELTEKIGNYMRDSLPERISKLHEDPNLSYVIPSIIIAPEIPNQCKLTVTGALEIGMGKRLAFEFDSPTGNKMLLLDKSTGKTVLMFDDHSSEEIKIKKIPLTEILRTIQKFVEISETKKEKCMYAKDFFDVSEDFLSDYTDSQSLEEIKEIYFEKTKINLIDAYFDEPNIIRNSVMDYVHMARAMWLSNLEHGDTWTYQDPLTKTTHLIQIKGRYVFAVEEKLGKMTEKEKNEFREIICSIYSQQVIKNPKYDFMDNLKLVNAVASVKLESYTPLNIISEKNKIIENMTKNSGYCKSCAEKTLEHFCISRV